MRIQDRTVVEGGRERIALVPESLDDLWHLNYVLEPGDEVSGETTRRIQRADDTLRDTGGEREHMRVTLEVETVEFHRFANRLRVSGVIVEASREDQLGLHHTLNVEERAEIAVTKRWKPDQLDRLNEAVEASERPDVAVVTVEEGEAHVHTIAQYGVEERTSITSTTGKGEYARSREELFEAVTSVLRHLDVDAIVLAGPGFTKQDCLDYVRDHEPDVAAKVTVVDTASVGARGVHEVLTRGAIDRVQAETRIAEEASLIDDLMAELATDGKAAYGPEEVERAADYGAVETLLILDERLRRERGGEGDWSIDVDALVRSVERQGGEVTVFSHEFDPGRQLENLGGVAAILRYPLG